MRTEFKTKEEDIEHFKQLGYKIKEGPNWFIMVPNKEEIELKKKESRICHINRKCLVCNSIFQYGSPRQQICNCCKIFIKCKQCKKYFEKYNLKNDIVNFIIENKEIIAFCEI